MKNLRKQIKYGRVTEEMLGNVIFTLNRKAKINKVMKQQFYEMKTELLKIFFTPIEIHSLHNKEYFYYEVNIYKFHVPCTLVYNQSKQLKVFLMDRDNPPKRKKMSYLTLKDCFYLYNNKEQICLAS